MPQSAPVAPRPLWQRVQEAQQAVTLLRQELEHSSRANTDGCRAASPAFFTYTAQLHQELDAAHVHLAELREQQEHDRAPTVPAAELDSGRNLAPNVGTGSRTTGGGDAPPMGPSAWAGADADLGQQIGLLPVPGESYHGASVCQCGGKWRYEVAGSDARPIWRCLHCGAVQQAER